ncbi:MULTISPECIES: putative ATP-grasp-modified RiPP [unclassified Streptomyces]|uniref:putative ATP-grasp-modified RiPP n=1 Tax=unclassified Streptomyces TaxID=2593676 RepID=UPI0034347895
MKQRTAVTCLVREALDVAEFSDGEAVPWGLTRMRPFPADARISRPVVVLDPETQTGQWLDEEGTLMWVMGKHKKSRTWTETKPKTSLDGNTDEGSDQDGDGD